MTQNMAKGLIPLDFIEEDIINVAARDQSSGCRGFDNLDPPRPLIPEFLVIHKEQSPPNSTVGSPTGYFTQTCCPALTDLEVNAVTGRMRRFVKRGSRIAGWANGRISAPYGDALAYINWKAAHGGWHADLANIMGEACEITGYFPSAPVTQDTAVSADAQARIARWMASRAHDYGIRWQEFPLVLNEGGRSYITWHREWTIGTGKTCPGPLVMALTPDLIEQARAIMKAAQGEDGPPVHAYAIPVGLPFDAQSFGFHDFNDSTAFVMTFTVETLKAAIPRAFASIKAPQSGDKIAVRDQVKCIAQIVTPDKRKWLIREDGSRLLASSFTPSLTVKKR
jgi:hypothetical protein